MRLPRALSLLFALILLIQPLAAQESLNVMFWNVESGGNDADTIKTQLTELNQQKGPFDLVGLSEVRSDNADDYVDALGDNYTAVVSNTGGGDRLVIAFNDTRFNLVQSSEPPRGLRG